MVQPLSTALTDDLEDFGSFLRRRIEVLPPEQRAFSAATLAAVLLETAGYEAAQTTASAHVGSLILLAAEAEKLAGQMPTHRFAN